MLFLQKGFRPKLGAICHKYCWLEFNPKILKLDYLNTLRFITKRYQSISVGELAEVRFKIHKNEVIKTDGSEEFRKSRETGS